MAVILKNPGDIFEVGAVDMGEAGGDNNNVICISLQWSHDRPGFFKRMFGRGAVDLDLGCYYKMRDGRCAVIDGLQFANEAGGPPDRRTMQGCYDYMPYIWHTGDNTGRDSEATESILVNPLGVGKIKCIMVYCFIYDGIGQWKETDALLTISFPGVEEVQVQVGHQDSDKRMCLVASIEFDDNGHALIRRVAEFYDNHSGCGNAHDWGLRFKPGYK